jgi:hypothetical protein
MLISLALIIPISLFVYVFAYHCDRDDARERADEFIAGIREPTPKDIDKCMRKLQVANSRLLDRNETDRRRVEILRGLRDNTVTSHP